MTHAAVAEAPKETKEQKTARKAKEQAELPTRVKKYLVSIVLTEKMLASSPADPDVYTRFIAEKKVSEAPKGTEAVLDPEEAETLSAGGRERSGWSVFHKDKKDNHIIMFDYQIRGFCKAAAEATMGTGGMSAYRSKIDKWLFIFPRQIFLYSADNKLIKEPDGVLERPVRAMTLQGPRVSLKRSDYLNPGTKLSCILHVLPLGQKEINFERLKSWFEYGFYSGLGEWRTGSNGRFEAKIEEAD